MKAAQKSTVKTTSKPAAKKSQTTGKSASGAKSAKKPDPLAMCPVNGAGWCPYPFSVAQLKRRLKARQAAAKQSE